MTPPPPASRRHNGLRVAGCAVLTLLSVSCILGFLLALYLEATGGIMPADDRRTSPAYLAALAGGALLSVLVPALACRRLMPPDKHAGAPAE